MVAIAVTTILVTFIVRKVTRDNRLRVLAQARYAAALAVYNNADRLFPAEISIDDLYPSAILLLEAEKDLNGPALATRAHLGRMKKYEEQLRSAWSDGRFKNFGDMPIKLNLFVNEAEYWAEKER